MKRSTVTMAAGLIFTAAALKLVFPAQTAEIIRSVRGGSETSSAVQETVSVSQDILAQPATVTINAAEFLGMAETSAQQDLPPAVNEAVETFLASQEPYEDLAVPVNVSYEVELPSFPFTAPVTAAASSGFGYRVHPLENLTKFHYGTDLAAMSGADIVSFADGKVSEVSSNETLGNYIRVSHDEGYDTLYAHCGTVYVHEGQSVKMGEKIALVGSTGKVTGPHLHFELMRNGVFLNPEFYLAAI
ncbi:MAG: M23 family metallopeptidase [Oscillospiraceae bacterium]|nr:M23 family metallopeptidase [Oscillospiraceae bacterium]